MLGTDTPQPTLVFNSTVFPALSILDSDERRSARAPLGRQAHDSESPATTARSATSSRVRARSPSRATGSYAFVADTDSEDLLVVDATAAIRGDDRSPAAGSPARRASSGSRTRSTSRSGTPRTSSRSRCRRGERRASRSPRTAPPFKTLASDPMPANLRLGQQLFFSANSDDVPDHPEPLGGVRELPRRRAERRGDVALRARAARHADQRRRDARHRVPLPDGGSHAGPGLLEDDRRRAGGRLPARRQRSSRSSTRSPRS